MSLYVPRGYVTTADAIQQIFEARHRDLAASHLARMAEIEPLKSHFRAEFPELPDDDPPLERIEDVISRNALWKRLARFEEPIDPPYQLRSRPSTSEQSKPPVGTFGQEHLTRLWELHQAALEEQRLRTEAAIELRVALAEGDLAAFFSQDEQTPIPKSRWRVEDGLETIWKGRMRQTADTRTQSAECLVVIKKEDLERWLFAIAQPNAGNADHGASSVHRNRSGPQPTKVENITERMISDYAASPADLSRQKQENLATQYGVSRDTVRRAREAALIRLSRRPEEQQQNSDK
jgi:hypothetical protein